MILPAPSMQVIKNCSLSNLAVLVLTALLWNCGCTPPGPRALLKGEKFIQQGNYEQAIEQLQTAVNLLPRNAQAWNHLGLAFHGHKEPARALKAYRQALALDHKLVAVRYNIGCLMLEEGDLSGAIDQLTSYTLLQPRAVDGLLKLATAELRAHRPDPAEKHFKAVLEMQPRNAEALNGLGVVQMQRRRTVEALGYFNQALAQSNNYGPALLNAAIVQHHFNNRPLALQRYREYLALQPRTENWGSVAMVANQLETELKPPPPAPAVVTPPIVAVVSPKSNPVVIRPEPVIRPVPTSAPPALVSVPRINPAPKSNPPKTLLVSTTNPAPLPIKTSTPPIVPPPVVTTPKPAELEVTRLSEDLVIKPAHDISTTTPLGGAKTDVQEKPSVDSTRHSTSSDAAAKTEKRGFLSNLNPFRKSKPTPNTSPLGSNLDGQSNSNVPVAATSEKNVPLPDFPRYTYLTPARPAAGKRADAERFFMSAVKAQQARDLGRAISEYQKAIQLDPAYFEAYYNQGLAASELGVWKTALTAFEYALALKADFTDARYNLALALKQGNYILDAVTELQTVLRSRPNEARVHLALANLYSQKLNQPSQARQHYVKVLELEPNHPRAAEIRYWLAAHP